MQQSSQREDRTGTWLAIRLLGELQVQVNGRTVRFATRPRARSLLAYLLLHKTEGVLRGALAAALWPDLPEDDARRNLRRHVYHVNRFAAVNDAGGPWILGDKCVWWNPRVDLWLDVAEFVRLSRDRHTLADAADLYRGDLLQRIDEGWLLEPRRRLRERYEANLSDLIAIRREQGDAFGVRRYAGSLLETDGLREDAVRAQIEIAAVEGDRSGAVRIYREYARRLHEELNEVPSSEMSTWFVGSIEGSRAVTPSSTATRHPIILSPRRAFTPTSRKRCEPALTVRLLGDFRLEHAGRPVRFVARPPAVWLLAYLLLHRRTAIARDTIAALLWPDHTDPEARGKLRKHVYQLNHFAAGLGDGPRWVLTDSEYLQWNPACDVWLDTDEFERWSEDSATLGKAVELYRGDLLQRADGEWLVAPRCRLREQLETNLAQLIALGREAGELLGARRYAERLVEVAPLREDAVRSAIALATAASDHSGALRLYEDFAKRIRDELDATPMAETTAALDAANNTPFALPTLPMRSPLVGRHGDLRPLRTEALTF